jgi:hypothetical protein
MRTALDSNILSSLWSNEPSAERIQAELRRARSQGGIVVCAPVYVELVAHPLVAPGFVDEFLAETTIAIDFDLDESIWRKAAEAFAAYVQRRRRSGGTSPKRVLPDFIMAAHALLRADQLMTLDPARYKLDFPKLHLV